MSFTKTEYEVVKPKLLKLWEKLDIWDNDIRHVPEDEMIQNIQFNEFSFKCPI